MSLEKLEDVVQLTPQVTRVLGQNPSPFTLQGTNCYLISPSLKSTQAILVDTGEGEEAFIPLLKQALDGRSISDIILTHWHHDHTDGLPSVLELLEHQRQSMPRIHQWPSSRRHKDALDLVDGQEINLGGSADLGEELTLTVLHVPGHTDDSIALHLNSLAGEAIFTADTVLGQGTAVFEDLAKYMASLKRLQGVLSAPGTPAQIPLYCGHGPVIADGRAKVEEYIAHRAEREKQVLTALEKAPEQGWSAEDLVDPIYGELAPGVRLAAIRGLQLILDKVVAEGKVVETSGGHYVLAQKGKM